MWTVAVVSLGALVLLALTFLLDTASRRRSAARDRSTLHVALLLNQADEGRRLLAANVDRPAPWWATTPPGQLARIDETLSAWGKVAGHVADGTVDRDVILDAFGRRIVAMWEDAYTYIEDRLPGLWEPLLDLYVDAWEAGHGDRYRSDDELEDGLAVTPYEVPEVEDLPADLLAPLLPTDAMDAAPEAEPDRLAVIQAALQPVPVAAIDTHTDTDTATPVRRSVTARDVDAPTDLLIDLIGISPHHVDGPLPRAVHR